MAWVPPATFDEYRLLRPLASGGMGDVYLGKDVVLDRLVAVKFISGLEPDERRRSRFLTEGRAIARLSHPNVVAVHRVGEVDGRPYLIAEYVHGQSLAELPRPLPPERVLQIGIGLARGLAAAHRQGVLHRDIKPANAMMTEAGDVKLLDFGLAKFLAESIEADSTATEDREPRADAHVVRGVTRAGAILGTPLYMAPETLRGEPATRRSDVYSLGAVLDELVSGGPPSSAEGERAPLAERAPTVPRPLAGVIDRCLRSDPAERFASAEELLAALETLVPRSRPAPLPEGNPYRGLSAFDAEHRALFFGRDIEVRMLLERLHDERLLIVVGDSGVGKSSLCRAGVLPIIEDGTLDGGKPIRVVRVVPGRRPVLALSVALAPSVEGNEEALAAWIRSDPTALARALHQRLQRRPMDGLLLFIDQLEELCTISDPLEARLFAEAVGHLASSAAQTRVLGTLRGDFFTRLASLPGLGEEVSRALFLLRPLSGEGMREAIVGPARQRGVAFESEELVTRIVASSANAAGGLPLLQFAMAELWDGRDRDAAVIRAAGLDRIGGVEGALARHADEVLTTMLPEERAAARRTLMRLVTAEGTRARRSASDLGAEQGPAKAALESLVRGRLVVAREAEGETAYEVAHEALIGSWKTLRDWLDADGDRRQIRERVEAASQEWERLGRTTDALWHERQLADVARLDEQELGERQRRFLGASRRAARRGRLLRRAALLGLPLVVVLVIAGARLKARWDTESRVDAKLAEAGIALAKARGMDEQAQAKRGHALRLFDSLGGLGRERAKQVVEQAEAEWAAVLEAESRASAAYLDAATMLESALLLSPTSADVRSMLIGAIDARMELAGRSNRPQERRELGERLATLDPSRRSRGGSGEGVIAIQVDPPDAVAKLERYERDERDQLRVVEVGRPAGEAMAPEGSYRLTFAAAGRATVRLPLLVRAGERRAVAVTLPPAAAIPPDFIFIPAGSFFFGHSDNEALRAALGTQPLHELTTRDYLIARHETTFGEWLQYLESLPPEERRERTPGVQSRVASLDLRPTDGGSWQLDIRPTIKTFSAPAGAGITFEGRPGPADWRRFPVLGISMKDAEAYARWLSETGRVPRARLCSEAEWVRAARGADTRIFTNGDRLDVRTVNIDRTYGRNPLAFGPDVIGSHPASDSPFGLADACGNAQEMVRTIDVLSDGVAVGGSWYFDVASARIDNRPVIESSTRSAYMGLRLCADIDSVR